MNRIVLLGRAGVGKSTLAQELVALGYEHIWLDDLWEGDVPAFRGQIEPLHSGDRWVSDGNFALATFDLRLPRATLILWLDRPTPICLWRSLIRTFKRGEPHRITGLLKAWAFILKFNRVNRPRIERAIREQGPDVPVRTIRSDREAALFVAEAAEGSI